VSSWPGRRAAPARPFGPGRRIRAPAPRSGLDALACHRATIGWSNEGEAAVRATNSNGDFSVKAIAGTHTVLLAFDCKPTLRTQLMGFAVRRETPGQPPRWLPSMKVFKSVVPDPLQAAHPNDPQQPAPFTTREHPIQSFLWGDYTAKPDTEYDFVIVPMFGKPGALVPQAELPVTIRTEKEMDQGEGVWFNRGAIASQAFAREFQNKAPENPDDPNDKETAWLSRGLLEACLKFINDTPAGDGLRVAAYEFTYSPILKALKAALDRGVDMKIVYHDTTDEAGKPNESAMATAGLPINDQKVTFRRSKTKIPHNKFIVRITGGNPVEVWTGSTNFTDSGFLGQTNVGHWVQDAATAKQYLDFWTLVSSDPQLNDARAGAMRLTPDPPNLVGPKSITRVFSPRSSADMLTWYGDRMEDATGTVMFTAAFGVSNELIGPLAHQGDYLRFILMEKPPAGQAKAVLAKDRDCIISYGAVLSDMYTVQDGAVQAKGKIAEFDLEKWYFLKEALYRTQGNIFYVHTKFLLIDPLSHDPLVNSGSANFSSNSLLQNDENMLLIRGSTRVADIYMTEFDRIFRHFYFRDIVNQLARDGKKAEDAFLSETPAWTDSYFTPGGFKCRRREMFFTTPARTWMENAQARPPFGGGGKSQTPKAKTPKAKTPAAQGTPKPSTPAKSKTKSKTKSAASKSKTTKRKPAAKPKRPAKKRPAKKPARAKKKR
jgi:phosphatidylserine/phosphatidylglycerophosphate/cardiolipin synthase-like enzyme